MKPGIFAEFFANMAVLTTAEGNAPLPSLFAAR
jgi:hypothetical protein